jgi:FtsP/CotA-like multicopper oxidase with cupredoxin domain
MALPAADELKDRVPSTQKPIQPSELTGAPQQIQLVTDFRVCSPDGNCSTNCDQQSDICKQRYMVNSWVFNPARPVSLKLGQPSKWTISSGDAFAHPFHIHVNPFMMTRQEPDATGKLTSATVWKDTISLPTDGTSISIMSRYTDFTGTFVLHCHILAHEDMGMMSLVNID